MKLNRRKIDSLTSFAFVLPLLLLFLVFFAYPIIYNIIISFYDWNGISLTKPLADLQIIKTAGGSCYVEMFPQLPLDCSFNHHYSVGNRYYPGFFFIRKIKLSGFYRILFYLPAICTPTIIGTVFSKIFETNRGYLNVILKAVHLDALCQPWLATPKTALICLIFVNIWQWTGYSMLMYYTNMLNISQDLYESATIDGAGSFKQFIYITFPLLKGTHITLILLDILGALKFFDLSYVLTKGGPAHATETFSTYIYTKSYNTFKQGEASTIVVFMFIIAMVLTVIQLKYYYKNEKRGDERPMKNSLFYKIVTQIVCLIVLAIVSFPLCLMVGKSLEIDGFGNYTKVFEYFDLCSNIITSIIVAGGTLLVVAIVVSMAAYAFSKLQFPHKRVVYYLLLTGMMIPTSALIFPLYQIVKGLQLNNTGWSLVFPYATSSACFNLMVLTNYYNALPDEMIDAARIDGANKCKTFRLIMLPVAKPGLVFVLIQTFLTSWNELQMALIFINDPDKQPLSVVPLRFAQTTTGSGFTINNLFAACLICLLPIAIFYILASRQLMEGLTAGAVKG